MHVAWCKIPWRKLKRRLLTVWETIQLVTGMVRRLSGSDSWARQRWHWRLRTTLVLLITFTHPHAAHAITISCSRSVMNCYLLESAPENHQSQTVKAAARPRATNALTLMVFFYGKESTLRVLLSSPFRWYFFLKLLENSVNSVLIQCWAQQWGLWERPQGATPAAWVMPLCKQPRRRTCISERDLAKPSVSYSVHKHGEDGAGKISWDLAELSAGGWPRQTPFWEAVSSLVVSAFSEEAKFCTLCVNKQSCVKDTHLSYH